MKHRRMIRTVTVALVAVCVNSVVQGQDVKPDAMDWPHWRGPQMNGVSLEKGIPDKWSPKGENLLWKREELGGRCTPIVSRGKLYLNLRDKPGTTQETEKVVCIDAKTGKTIWENKFNVFLSDVPDTRVGWSSVFADQEADDEGRYRVYSLGVCGYFQCLDADTGKTIWSHSMSEEYGLLNTYGGRTNFPIVHQNLVIISGIVIGWGEMAKPAHRFIGFDKRNGQPVWFESTRIFPYDTTYSSPVLTVINGQSMIVFGSGDGGVHAMQPQTGKKVWTFNVSRRGINTTPLVVGNTVFCGHSEENIGTTEMGALFAIDATKTGTIGQDGVKWKKQQWFVGKSSPLYINGRIYACEDTGTLLVVDAKNGEQIAKQRLKGPMRSSPLYVDGKILLCTENSIWSTLKPTDEGVEVVHQARLQAGDSYGSPIVSHGRLYVPTTEALYCIGTPDQKPSADPLPEPVKETAVSEDGVVAHVQVVPVESLLIPSQQGQMQQFQVRLFNENGQYLKAATEASKDKIKFSIDGPGKIDEKTGLYVTPDENVHQGVAVTAQVGELAGKARIRVIADLPWSFDFSDGQVPITWVGCRYRHLVVDHDLFTKLTEKDALAGQLYIYLMSDFTNQAKDTVVYNDNSPRLPWTEFLRYLQRIEQATDLDKAKAALDPSLELLKQEKVVSEWAWEALEVSPQLTVKRGERKIDGNGAMLKITTIPKGKRSQGWIGYPNFQDYTFQADVLGMFKNGKLPDIGITVQRYVFDLMGASQKLQIRTWHTQLDRMSKEAPFAWETKVWYTMKFQASHEGKKAIVKGKVWKRGDKEPEKWMIEAEDEIGNVNGSPGFFGNAFDAELFYDNIKITKNE